MENASKALIMAGSVLLALLVIGTLVFMFHSLSNLKAEEATSEEVIKLVEYNKKIETFDRARSIWNRNNITSKFNYRL